MTLSVNTCKETYFFQHCLLAFVHLGKTDDLTFTETLPPFPSNTTSQVKTCQA